MRILALRTGRFVTMAELTREADDALTSPLFPGLRVALSEVFPPRERS